MKLSRNILAHGLSLLVVSLLIVTVTQARADNNRQRQAEDKRKAEYLYLAAQQRYVIDDNTGHSGLIESAYRLDTTETVYASDLGFIYLSAGDVRGYDMIKRHYLAHPEDFYSTRSFALIAGRLNDRPMVLSAWATLDSLKPGKPEITLEYARAIAATPDSTGLIKAVNMLSDLQQRQGYDPGIGLQVVSFQSLLGDTIGMLNEAKSQIDYSPRSAASYLLAYQVNNFLGRNDSARQYIERAIEMNPDNGVAHYYYAQLLNTEGDTVGYENELYNVLVSADTDPEMRQQIIREYVLNLYDDPEQYPRITNMFERMLAVDPHDSNLRSLYGSFLLVTKQPLNAVEQYQIIADLNPGDYSDNIRVAQIYAISEHYDLAEAKIIELEPRFSDNPELYLMWAYIIMTDGQDRYDEALDKLNHAVELTDSADNETLGTLYDNIGNVLSLQGDKVGALNYYQKALDLKPDDMMIANNVAYFLAETDGDLQLAETLSYVTIIDDPTSATKLDTYAWILFKRKEFTKSLEYIERALQAVTSSQADDESDTIDDSNNVEVYEHAGDIYFFNQLPDKALEYWQKALDNTEEPSEILKSKVKQKTYIFPDKSSSPTTND